MGKEIIQVATSVLRVHPRNSEFFDDISGAEYERFKKSIQDDGLLSPLIVAPDMTVISGHQRLKACKELNYKTIPVIINDDLNEEDIKLKKLIAANFGRLKNDPIKQAKLIKEYEKLCGVRQGSARQKVDRDNRAQPQEHIAKELGISLRQLQDIKRLTTLLPDLQDIISEGRITATTGYKVLAKLSSDEQKKLLESLPETRQFTQKQISEYISKLQEKDNIIAGYEIKILKIKELESSIADLKHELDTRPVVNHEIIKEVVPNDYQDIKCQVKDSKNDYDFLKRDYDNKIKQLNELKAQIKAQQEQTPEAQFDKKIKDSTLIFCAKVAKFIEEVGGYVWLTEYFEKIPKLEKQGYISSVNALDCWLNTLKDSLN